MSEREKIAALLEDVPPYKLGYVRAFLMGLTADEKQDDAFCEELWNRYQADPEREEEFSLEDCKREWDLV
jgi:hypothetical protein